MKLDFDFFTDINSNLTEENIKLLSGEWDFWPMQETLASLKAATAQLFCAAPTRDSVAWPALIIYTRTTTQAEILYIFVRPPFRGQGIGDLLLETFLHTLGTEGVERIFLEVRPSNLPAIDLYRKHGFSEIGRRPGYYRDGEDALIMHWTKRTHI